MRGLPNVKAEVSGMRFIEKAHPPGSSVSIYRLSCPSLKSVLYYRSRRRSSELPQHLNRLELRIYWPAPTAREESNQRCPHLQSRERALCHRLESLAVDRRRF